MSLFIQAAHAAEPVARGQSPFEFFIIMALMMLVFYFILWRPQMKRNKEHRNMIENLTEGSEVVFAGGLMGNIKKLDGEYAVVSLNERNDIMVQKASILSVLPTGTIDGLK